VDRTMLPLRSCCIVIMILFRWPRHPRSQSI
jgi:hypothetical protein